MAPSPEKITVYVTAELKDRLVAIAERERRSLNAQLGIALEEYADVYEIGAAPSAMSLLTPEALSPHPVATGGVLETAPRRRTQMCPHRLLPEQFCAVCDV